MEQLGSLCNGDGRACRVRIAVARAQAEDKWALCSWPAPTLPPRTREGWGNLWTRTDLKKDGPAPSYRRLQT